MDGWIDKWTSELRKKMKQGIKWINKRSRMTEEKNERKKIFFWMNYQINELINKWTLKGWRNKLINKWVNE